ncbi:MAG: AbrB/MazE/SpoVT family DNA-binding domain-containing protein [Deltaproteobacteria bacterium]|nr:AbrB/MazE/SpoVT family DNA-binding domain-containing protein [Deltaproteobacteria bacterium]
MMLHSRLTSKFQATVPLKVREKLGLKKGDLLEFTVRKGAVTLKKATPADLAFTKALQSTLSEWESENDEEAYRDL